MLELQEKLAYEELGELFPEEGLLLEEVHVVLHRESEVVVAEVAVEVFCLDLLGQLIQALKGVGDEQFQNFSVFHLEDVHQNLN